MTSGSLQTEIAQIQLPPPLYLPPSPDTPLAPAWEPGSCWRRHQINSETSATAEAPSILLILLGLELSAGAQCWQMAPLSKHGALCGELGVGRSDGVRKVERRHSWCFSREGSVPGGFCLCYLTSVFVRKWAGNRRRSLFPTTPLCPPLSWPVSPPRLPLSAPTCSSFAMPALEVGGRRMSFTADLL